MNQNNKNKQAALDRLYKILNKRYLKPELREALEKTSIKNINAIATWLERTSGDAIRKVIEQNARRPRGFKGRRCKECGTTENLVCYGLPDKYLCKEHMGLSLKYWRWTNPDGE